MSDDTRLRPVLALEQALGRLESLVDPGDPARGPARQRAVNAARAIPAGALAPARRDALAARLELAVGDAAAIPARATRPPVPAPGTTWWLSSHDDLGAVLRVRLERLGPAERPWPRFWPGAAPADAAADAAAERAFAWAARRRGTRPLTPRLGWHRVVLDELPAAAAPRVEGGSMGAALALMLLSAWSDVPLDPGFAVTGDLDDAGRLTLPEGARRGVHAKVVGLHRERACVRRLFVPVGFAVPSPPGGPEVIPVEDLDALADAVGLAPGPFRPATLPAWLEAVEEARWLDRVRAVPVPVLAARLEALAEAWPEIATALGREPVAVWTAHLALLTLLCAYRSHAGRPEAAAEVAAALDARLTEGRPPPALVAWARNVEASGMIDRHHFEAARAYLAEAEAAADAAADAVEGARIASTAGRVEAHAGRDAEALVRLDDALARFADAAPWEANIGRAYRIGALARLGRVDAARAALAEARAESDREPGMSDGWRRANELYLAYEALRVEAAAPDGDLDGALTALADRLDADGTGPWPHAGACARAVEACLAAGDGARARRWEARLAALAGAHPGPVTDHALGRVAAVRVARALEADGGAAAVLPPDLEARLGRFLSRLPLGPESRFRAPARAYAAARGEGDDAAAAAALRTILAADLH